jgi:hypothetical protein
MYMGYAIDAGFKQLKICDSTWLNARISPKGSDQRRKPQILLSLFVHRWGFGKQTTNHGPTYVPSEQLNLNPCLQGLISHSKQQLLRFYDVL